MSNSLGIAAVTSCVRYLVDRMLQAPHAGQVGGAAVTTLRPDALGGSAFADRAGVNVYCYQVRANNAWNLTDLPTRSAAGMLTRRPVAALDLSYLVSCVGDDEALEPQRLLGRAVLALTANPVLTRDTVATALAHYAADADTEFLTGADLAGEVELVKLSPVTLSTEELSDLWSLLGAGGYQLSVVYTATVVLLTVDSTPAAPLPVRQRIFTTTPSGPPVLDTVAVDPEGEAARSGAEIVLRGTALPGPGSGVVVRVGPAELTADVAAEGLRVTLDETVPAGVQAVQVITRTAASGAEPARVGLASNALPLLVRPTVDTVAVSDTEVTVTFRPPAGPRQQVGVRLSPLDSSDGSEAADVLVLMARVAEGADPVSSVTVDRTAVADGRWLVRVQVDGVESLPDTVDGVYASPDLVLPPP